MRFIQKFSRFTLTASGVSLAALVAVALPSTAAYVDDEKKIIEEKKKKSKTVRVISAGKPIVIERSGNHYILKGKTHDDHDDEHEHHSKKDSHTYSFTYDRDERSHYSDEAMQRIEASLEKVEKRLEKARKKAEKAALEAARDGLKTAIEALKSARGQGHHTLALGELRNGHGVFSRDLRAMRLNIDGDLGELQETIEDALGDVELDMDLDIDVDTEVDRHTEKNVKVLRFKDGKHRIRSFGMSDEKRLEALKHAEEELRQSREKLEKRLAEKKEKDREGE